MSQMIKNSSVHTAYAPSLKGRLLQCAAASAAAWALLPTAAHAAIPPECDEQVNPNIISCVVPAPDEVGQIGVNQDNTTIVIGSADTPTTVNTVEDIGIRLFGDGAQTIIVNEGSIVNSETGIGIYHEGDALLSIFTGEGSLVSGGELSGIKTFNSAGDAATNLNIQGSVIARLSGISVANNGVGGVNIVARDVTSLESKAIGSGNNGDGGTNIDTTGGLIQGADGGVLAVDNGAGSLTIATAAVQAGTGIGIEADKTVGGDVSITSNGAVLGAGDAAISVRQDGTGGVSIVTANVLAPSANGIEVMSGANSLGGIVIDSTAGAIRAFNNGIEVDNGGEGLVGISAADISTSEGKGIEVTLGELSTGVSIDSTAGTINSDATGVWVNNAGVGDTVIFAADISSANESGVFAFNQDAAGSITIDTTAGTIEQGLYGVDALNDGTGSTRITTADVNAALGIRAITSNSSSSIDTRAGTVSANTHAIFAEHAGSGALFIQTGDLSGQNDSAIFARNSGGDETAINTTEGSVSGGSSGIQLEHTAPGGAEIQTADVTAGDSIGISVQTSGNALSIDTVEGTVSTGGTHGIQVVNTGTGNSSVRTADVVGGEIAGVLVFTGDTTINSEVDTSEGFLTAGATGVNHIAIGQGDATTKTGNVSAEGMGVRAVKLGATGDNTVDTTTGSVRAGDDGIDARLQTDGALRVTTANVTSQNGRGIFAEGAGSEVSLDTSAGVVTAGGAYAIEVDNIGSGATSLRTANVEGGSSAGVLVMTGESATTSSIDTSAGAILASENDGVVHLSTGAGDMSTITANVVSDNTALIAEHSGLIGSNIVDTTAGSISSTGAGLDVSSSARGEIRIATADVLAEESFGISSFGDGDVTGHFIDTTAGAIRAGENGIQAFHLGSGALSAITADVTALTGRGVDIRSTETGGDVVIDTRLGSVSAQDEGVFSLSQGSGTLSIMTADVTSSADDGVAAGHTTGGDFSIDTTAGVILGQDHGILAVNDAAGTLSITAGNVTGVNGEGIEATNTASGVDILVDSSAGDVSGGFAGILAVNSGTGAVGVRTANVTSAGETAIGAGVSDIGTNLTVDTTAGSVEGALSGIETSNLGSGTTRVTTADVTGSNGNGITAGHSGSDFTVDTRLGTVTASENGIEVHNDGTGATAIVTADVTSANGIGVQAQNELASGAILVDTSAGAVSAATDGLLAEQQSANDLNITTGDVFAGDDAVELSLAGGVANLTNTGTLRGAQGFEVRVRDGSAGDVNTLNTGVIEGAVSLGTGNDTVTNAGVFAANGESLFGQGSDVFANTGTLRVAGAVQFSELEQISNGGLITMADGVAGGSLTVDGDYVGQDGALALDIDFAAPPTADTLIIGGSATGSTTLTVDGLMPLDQFGASVVVVDADAGTDAQAFTLEGGNTHTSGLFSLGLIFDALENDFLLSSAIGTPVFQSLKVGEGAQNVWYRSADAWAAHIENKRHTDSEERSPLWLEFYGSTGNREESFAFTGGGFNQDITLDYSQDYFGLQGGFEFGPGSKDEGAFFGLTAGYLNSQLGFDNSGDLVDFSAFNLGAYAGYKKDGFFANALAKYDFITADIENASAGFDASVSADTFGARGQVGYRWTTKGGFFLEPSASLEFQTSSLDDLNVGSASFAFDGFDGLRGQAGARIGGETATGSGNIVTYYAGARAVHEFAGDGQVSLSLPQSSTTITNDPIDTFGRVDLGINIATKGRVTGFIEGNADISGNYNSFGGRAGLRIAF
ncbi:MAG: autotransporter outer membrane beta-barrel domain-containing protein [Pseudomonadota bacterium]